MEPTNTTGSATIDLLQKKIDKARAELSEKTRRAIDAVDWKSAILGMREKKGYNLEQLEDLEIETELLLCGLINPENYPKELENRMKIPKVQVDVLINEMNELVFKKIRDELMKNDETQVNKTTEKDILKSAQIEIVPEKTISPRKEEAMEKPEDMLSKVENPELINKEIQNEKIMQSIASQKLSGSFQIPTVKTEYTLNNISKQNTANQASTDVPATKPKIDPYRELPE